MTPKLLFAIVLAAAAPRASALQPLAEFLRTARTGGVDAREAQAVRRQSAAEASAALGRALPRVSVRGAWTRNELETTIALPGDGGPARTVTITPRDQLDATATLDVPLVDLATFARVGAARSSARAGAAQAAATDLRVQALVAQQYYQLVADMALTAAASRALDVARASLATAEQRHGAGAVALLDVDRARAEVERNVQQLASADLQVALVARALSSLTGLSPEVQGEAPLADDLHAEPPLERFQPPDAEIPALAAAIQARIASEREARAQRFSLVPSLSASVSERASNAPGLVGQDRYWQAVLGLSWTLDLTTFADVRARDAAAEGARAREERARLAARDDVHRAWNTVAAGIVRSRSARVQAEVSARAAALALQRYQVGESAQLDLLQAQRDAFAAQAARIQADADLVNSRAQLRVAAGESLLAPSAERAP